MILHPLNSDPIRLIVGKIRVLPLLDEVIIVVIVRPSNVVSMRGRSTALKRIPWSNIARTWKDKTFPFHGLSRNAESVAITHLDGFRGTIDKASVLVSRMDDMVDILDLLGGPREDSLRKVGTRVVPNTAETNKFVEVSRGHGEENGFWKKTKNTKGPRVWLTLKI